MPEVERPEFRKDAKPTERSYGKNVVRGEGLSLFGNGCGDGEVGGRSLSLATDRAERILTLMKSQNVAIYNKK